jgi:catechol 2,3-dioxygenase-like lactoylglutathione lyase family enzyme
MIKLIGQLHHIEIYVSDLKKSKEFWGWLLPLLGYEEYQNWPGGISYILGSIYIVFVQAANRFLDIHYHRCRTGLNHLAFYGDDEKFIDSITAQLREKGVRILYEDRHPRAGGNDYYGVFFEDPDRIKVEIVAKKV